MGHGLAEVGETVRLWIEGFETLQDERDRLAIPLAERVEDEAADVLLVVGVHRLPARGRFPLAGDLERSTLDGLRGPRRGRGARRNRRGAVGLPLHRRRCAHHLVGLPLGGDLQRIVGLGDAQAARVGLAAHRPLPLLEDMPEFVGDGVLVAAPSPMTMLLPDV
ncbi:hypothetical protein ACWCPT_35300 [Streptomyces sp. NPDC002308]